MFGSENMASNKKSVVSTCTGSLFLLVFLLNTDVCLGVATTTLNCMDKGHSGLTTTLVCKITGTVISGIKWLRPNSGSSQQVISCNIANDQCIATGGVTGYSVSIDSPTQHTLTIASFNSSVDAGLWICRDGATGDGQVSCEKEVESSITCDWCIGLSVMISILIAVGIALIIAIFLVSGASLKKILIIVVIVVGGILLIMAIVVAVLLGIQTDADLGTGAYLAAAVFCGFGFVVGIILVAVGVWLQLKTGNADSGSVSNKPTELHSTNTPGQPTELDSTNAHRRPLNANNETTNRPPK